MIYAGKRLEEALVKRAISERLIANILRLNPFGFPEGVTPRGYYRKPKLLIITDCCSKGMFIRRWGRDAWNALPPNAIRKDGRRKYVSGLAVAMAGLK